MLLYNLAPQSPNGPGGRYRINASHPWGLPGVRCGLCGDTWAAVGVEYPTVDLSKLPDEHVYRSRSPISVAAFEQRRAYVEALVAPGQLLRPGTAFGPLQGTVTGQLDDFVWKGSWSVLSTRGVHAKLSAAVPLPLCVDADLKWRNRDPQLAEWEIEALCSLSARSFVDQSPRCNLCGRHPRKLGPLVVDRGTVPEHVDVFRTREFAAYIIATEAFRAAVEEGGLTGMVFTPVEVE